MVRNNKARHTPHATRRGLRSSSVPRPANLRQEIEYAERNDTEGINQVSPPNLPVSSPNSREVREPSPVARDPPPVEPLER